MGKRSRDTRGLLGGNGKATRIPKLDTPEEVQKWIEERRRRYPSSAPRETEAEEGECKQTGDAAAATDDGIQESSCPEAHHPADLADKEGDGHISKQSRARPCKYFLRGRCRHGDQCKYLHAKGEVAATHTRGTTKSAAPGLLSRLDEEVERLEGVLAVLRFLQSIEYQIGPRDA